MTGPSRRGCLGAGAAAAAAAGAPGSLGLGRASWAARIGSSAWASAAAPAAARAVIAASFLLAVADLMAEITAVVALAAVALLGAVTGPVPEPVAIEALGVRIIDPSRSPSSAATRIPVSVAVSSARGAVVIVVVVSATATTASSAREFDPQLRALKFSPIEGIDGVLSVASVVHLDEGEAGRVVGDPHVRHAAVLLERLLQIPLVRLTRDVSHVYLGGHLDDFC